MGYDVVPNGISSSSSDPVWKRSVLGFRSGEFFLES